jgi:hypothetical protein
MHSLQKLRDFLLIAIFCLLNAAQLRILSAGAPETALRRAITIVAYDPQSGQFLDIRPEQIQISGISARAVRCERLTGPRHIILLLDVSASSTNSPVLRRNLVETASGLIAQSRPGDWLALHAFAKRHRVVIPFSQDTSRIQGMINSIGLKTDKKLREEYGSSTELKNALEASLASSGANLKFGDAIVLISAGHLPRITWKYLQKIHEELIRLSVRLYMIDTSNVFRPVIIPEDQADVATMEQEKTRVEELREGLVVPVGGAIVATGPLAAMVPVNSRVISVGADPQPFNSELIVRAAGTLMAMIRSAFRVEVEILEPIGKSRAFTLKHRGPENEKGGEIQLQYPQWILPEQKQ